MPIATINPATGELVREFAPHSDTEVEARLAAAARAFPEWRKRSTTERARVVGRAGEILESEKATFGRLMTLEMGKPLRAAIEESAKCAVACRYYSEHAERFMAVETLLVDGSSRGEVRY